MIVKENYDFTDWLINRNKELVEYQLDRMPKVIQSIVNNELPTVLAAAPGAGKTLMSIAIIDMLLKDNPNLRVLGLIHGTTILRTQYVQEIEQLQPEFTHCEITSGKELAACDAQVVLAIPQTIAKLKKLPKFDILVCDEAHNFYSAEDGMVQNIIQQTGIKYQLLLTGSPSKFILREFPLISVPLEEVMDAGRVAPLTPIVSSSRNRITLNNFNQDGELNGGILDNQEAETIASLDKFLSDLEKNLKSVLNFNQGIKAKLSTLTGWQIALKQMEKTMIAAHSQEQGRHIRNYFLSKGINVALSISDDDKTSDEIRRFISEDDCLILIVVGRGILGFNYTRLVNVIDMTYTRNLDRIFQLLCRVVRTYPGDKDKQKFFYKIAPRGLEQSFEVIMTGTMCLANKHYFETFNGRNFLDMQVPVVLTAPTPEPGEGGREPGEGGNRPPRPQIVTNAFLGLPDGLRLFKDLLHKDNKEAMVNHSYASIADIKLYLGEIQKAPNGYWTLERCQEIALKFTSRGSFWKNARKAYDAACSLGILDEICSHMVEIKKPQGYWNNKENCAEVALKYTTRKDFRDNEASAYNSARKNGWLNEICSHMTLLQKPQGYWIKERCHEVALKFTSRSSFKNGEASAFNAARENGWLDEICSHMVEIKKPKNYWNKERCHQLSLKYTTKKEFRENEPSAYAFASVNGFINEICSHMVNIKKPNGYWTLERCIEEAKKYKTMTEWNKNSYHSYRAAQKNGWLEECKKYFKK